MIYLFQFITMAFPKAGLLYHGIPFTVSTVLFLVALFFCRKNILKTFKLVKGMIPLYLIFVTLVIISMWININSGLAMRFATSLVYIASPLAISIGYSSNKERALKVIAISLIIIGAYSFLQRLFGLDKTTINGLNIAFGDSFLNKPIGINQYGYDFIKCPSTYQNGNLLAPFCLISIPMILIWEAKKVAEKAIKILSISFGTCALILSGARSYILPLVIFIPFVLILISKKFKYKNQLLFFSTILLIILTFIIYITYFESSFLTYLFDRYINRTLTDPTMAGRTTQYLNFLGQITSMDSIDIVKYMFFGIDWESAIRLEGYLNISVYSGFITMIIFLMILIKPIIYMAKSKKLTLLCLAFVCFLIGCALDTSFDYPPTLINAFFIMGMIIKMQTNAKELEYSNKRVNLSDSIREQRRVTD